MRGSSAHAVQGTGANKLGVVLCAAGADKWVFPIIILDEVNFRREVTDEAAE